MKNCTAPGPDRIKPEHLKSVPTVIIRTLVRLFTRYLSECKVPTSWKTSKTELLYKKGDPDNIGNYRAICLLSVIYNLFTRVILNRIGRMLVEGQSCEQAGLRRGFGTIDHIHTLTRLIEVSREYKMPLCLTFIDLKKAFDTVEAEAVFEALDNQGVPTQYIRMLREFYDSFTTRISPFYKEVTVNVERGIRQGDTISPKLFSAALEKNMSHLGWEDLVVKVDGCHLHHLRFADDIVLITPNIEQAERMLAEFNSACGKVGLRLNLTKTMFMKKGLVPVAHVTLNGTNISSYVYLGREINMMNNLAPEPCRRKHAARGAFRNIEEVVKRTKNIQLRVYLFDTSALRALTHASETWTLRKQDEHAVSATQRALGQCSEFPYTRKCRREFEVPSSVTERRSGKPLITPRNRRSGGPDTLCDIAMTVGPGRLLTGSLVTSNERHGQTSSRKLLTKGMLNLVSLKRGRFTGPLWLVTGTNGDVTGARSRKSMISGTTDDIGDNITNRTKGKRSGRGGHTA
nr:RNA-directed DNA polymerase (reverse transcriptase) domain containing protein [Haemonchus contortus]